MLNCNNNGKIAVTDMIDAINSKQNALTNAQVKQKYEANGNTNAYTDSDKSKVSHALTQSTVKAPLVLRGHYSAVHLRNNTDDQVSYFETNKRHKEAAGGRFGRLSKSSNNNYVENRSGINIIMSSGPTVMYNVKDASQRGKSIHINPTYTWNYQGKVATDMHKVYNPTQSTNTLHLASEIDLAGKATTPSLRMIKSNPNLDAIGSNHTIANIVAYGRTFQGGKVANVNAGEIAFYSWGSDWNKKDANRSGKDTRSRIGFHVRNGTGITFYSNSDKSSHFRPYVDNKVDLGASSYRFRTVYAYKVNTPSDDRLKQDKRAISDAEYQVAGSLIAIWQAFKYKEQVAEEAAGGDKARIYFGVIAQEIVAKFTAGGLDALDYGILSHDVTEAIPPMEQDESDLETPEIEVPEDDELSPETLDADGIPNPLASTVANQSYTIPAEVGTKNIITELGVPAGDVYHVDYTALTQFVLAAFFKGMADAKTTNPFSVALHV